GAAPRRRSARDDRARASPAARTRPRREAAEREVPGAREGARGGGGCRRLGPRRQGLAARARDQADRTASGSRVSAAIESRAPRDAILHVLERRDRARRRRVLARDRAAKAAVSPARRGPRIARARQDQQSQRLRYGDRSIWRAGAERARSPSPI